MMRLIDADEMAAMLTVHPKTLLAAARDGNAAIRAVVKASNGAAIPGLRIWQEGGAIVRGAAPLKVDDFDY